MLKMILTGENVRTKGRSFGDLLWARGERGWFSKMSTSWTFQLVTEVRTHQVPDLHPRWDGVKMLMVFGNGMVSMYCDRCLHRAKRKMFWEQGEEKPTHLAAEDRVEGQTFSWEMLLHKQVDSLAGIISDCCHQVCSRNSISSNFFFHLAFFSI